MYPIPKITLNDGNRIPIIGLGTWKSYRCDVYHTVKNAIDVGYRHFDCAYVFGNEKEIGHALNSKIIEGVVKRKDLFITSKLWNSYHLPELVESICRSQLETMGLEYFDLYIIHYQLKGQDYDIIPKVYGEEMTGFDFDYVDTWQAMENLIPLGLAKSIGVSNFNTYQLKRLLKKCRIKPVTNQIESHPYFNQNDLIHFCKANKITITAFSPLGSPGNNFHYDILRDPSVIAIAEKYEKTPAQILLRYHVQRGHIVVPKTVSKFRLEENVQIFDFILSYRDLQELESLERNMRFTNSVSRI